MILGFATIAISKISFEFLSFIEKTYVEEG
jgi:hypothetical protein